MANFIKIKATDIDVANQLSDVIIGGVDSVYQGLANGGVSADKLQFMLEVKVIYSQSLEKEKSGLTRLYQLQLQIQEDL